MSIPGVRVALRMFGVHIRGRVLKTTAARPAHLDAIVAAFLDGYASALDVRDIAVLVRQLSEVRHEYQGFSFEGAAMALTLLDGLSPWRADRFHQFAAAADRHIYVLHVGAGWALARLGRGEGRFLNRLDPVLRWLAIDGAGFHDGYFGAIGGRMRRWYRARLSAYGQRVFDQGLGRSLWFTEDADVARIASTIRLAAPARHHDLWSGVGLACTYAGGVDSAAIERLREASGASRVHVAQGSAFGTAALVRAFDRVPPHADLASRILGGISGSAAAAITREAAIGLPVDGNEPAYEVWRSRVRSHLRAMDARTTPVERVS